MELRIKPCGSNSFPLEGILIKGNTVKHWIKEIQWMGLSLSSITAYPIPGKVANSIWGCLIHCNGEANKIDIGRNSYCQLAHGALFIPEKSRLYPALSSAEAERLFAQKHILHPEFGLVELEDVIDWSEVIELPVEVTHTIKKPKASVVIPKKIRSFQVKPVAANEVLEQFEEKHFPKPQKFTDKPLNPFEKAKLFFYRQLFSKQNTGVDPGKPVIEKTPLLSKLESLRKLFSKKETDWTGQLAAEFEELEKRNQKHFDRLMDLLKKDPSEALKYAIPLDTEGTVRGYGKGVFDLQKRWFDFSLFGSAFQQGSGSGTAVLPDNAFYQLQMQYTNTAQELIKQNEHQKAAFVYMKLLKNYPLAAQTLENGRYYQEAASIYLQYAKNKPKAAECYEKGKMIMDAIELYKELNQDEKVGDLYCAIGKKKEAFLHYEKVVEGYTENHQYVKASLLYKNKMDNREAAQDLLLKGWRTDSDAFNCLNNYFSNIGDVRTLEAEIKAIYTNDVVSANRETFLRVIKYEYEKQNELATWIKDMSYEIIVSQIAVNPSIVSELHAFNKEDKELIKDTLRFKANAKRRT